MSSIEYLTSSEDTDDEQKDNGMNTVISVAINADSAKSTVKCQKCFKSMAAKEIQAHMEHEHGKCKYCESFIKPALMQKHIHQKHTDVVVIIEKSSHSVSQVPIQKHVGKKQIKTVKCRYCKAERHEKDIKQHELTHFVKCDHCERNFLRNFIECHIAVDHASQRVIGSIQLEQIDDDKFNQLINEKRIYAKNGKLFIK